LKDNLESAFTDSSSNQLIAVTVRLVPTHLKVGEETFHGLLKCDVMCGEFVPLKVVFEVGRCETMPIDHCVLLRVSRLCDKWRITLQLAAAPRALPRPADEHHPTSPTASPRGVVSRRVLNGGRDDPRRAKCRSAHPRNRLLSAVRLTVNLHSTTQNCRGNTQQANVTRKFRVVLTGERLRRLDNCMLSNGLLIRANAG